MHFLPTDTTHLTFSNQLTLLRFVREKAQSQQRPVAWVTRTPLPTQGALAASASSTNFADSLLAACPVAACAAAEPAADDAAATSDNAASVAAMPLGVGQQAATTRQAFDALSSFARLRQH